MKNLFVVLFTVFFYLALTGCRSKTILCPAFDKTNFVKWFPYKKGEMVTFRNTTTEKIYSQPIEDVLYSSEYVKNPGGMYGFDKSCNQSANVTSDSMSISYVVYQEGVNGPINSVVLNVSVVGGGFMAGNISENSLTEQPTSSAANSVVYKTNASIFPGGTVYERLAIITATGNFNHSRPDELYIAKGNGLVGYKMHKTGELWIRQ